MLKGTAKPIQLSFTGERLIPELNKGAAFYYEHIARYYFAAQFAKNQQVLDAGCGVGYGTNILATYGKASQVTGIDISAKTIAFAKQRYSEKNINFLTNSILNMTKIKTDSTDVVVSFEVIEHVKEQDEFLSEVSRVLKPGGLFLVSTPNKNTYKEGNEFHLKELYPNEFSELLKKYFINVKIYHQNFEFSQIIHSTSSENFGIDEKFVSKQSKVLSKNPDKKYSQYMVAICSNGPIPKTEPLVISTAKVDGYDLARGIESIGAGFTALQTEHDLVISEIQKLNDKNNELIKINQDYQKQLVEAHGVQQDLASELQSLRNATGSTDHVQLVRFISSLYAKRMKAWLLMNAVVSLIKRVIIAAVYLPFVSLFFLLSWVDEHLHSKQELKLSKKTTQLNGISFIIPTWNKKELVVICVKLLDKAINHLKSNVKTEIIVIDNGSADGTSEALKKLNLKNELVLESLTENLGFARAINLGASKAKYNYIYVLNNDMEVASNFLSPLITFAQNLLKNNHYFFGLASQIFFFDPTKRREESGKTYSKFAFGFLKVAHFVESATLQEDSYTLYPGGGSSLLNKSLFLAMGGYDHRSYTPLYCEDLDAGVSAWSYGYPSYFVKASKVIHHHRSSSKQLSVDPSFYMFKNWLVLLLKQLNDPRQILSHILLYSLRIITDKWYAKYALEAIKNSKNIWLSRRAKHRYVVKHSSSKVLNFVDFEIASFHEKA